MKSSIYSKFIHYKKDLDALLQSHLPSVWSIAEMEEEASLCIINSYLKNN